MKKKIFSHIRTFITIFFSSICEVTIFYLILRKRETSLDILINLRWETLSPRGKSFFLFFPLKNGPKIPFSSWFFFLGVFFILFSGNCKKLLDSGNITEHDGEMFCTSCYRKFFGPKGYGFGGGAGTLSMDDGNGYKVKRDMTSVTSSQCENYTIFLQLRF